MEFTEYKCPVCDKQFKKGDDVVVCPECGTPHHRECYEKEGHCHFADRHGADFSFEKEQQEEAEQQAEQSVINAVDGISFKVEEGEFAIVVGASGAGKTTVLNILGGMDSCSEGEIIVGGKDISKFKDKQLIEYRRYDIGFVFQFYNLVQNLTALENVELASEICRDPLDPAETLRSVGLGERLTDRKRA